MLKANSLLTTLASISWTCTVREDSPFVKGVPLMRPLVDSKVNPSGSVPDVMVQAYRGLPPTASSAASYSVPSAPDGS